MPDQPNFNAKDSNRNALHHLRQSAAAWRLDGDKLVEAGWALTRFSAIAMLLAAMHNVVAVQVSLFALIVNLAWDKKLGFHAFAAGRSDAAARARQAGASIPKKIELQKARRLIDAGHCGEAHLVALGDKQILWSSDGSAFLMYARKGGSLMALFDPVGEPHDWPELLQAFRQLASRQSCSPAFYQASAAFRRFAVQNGMRGYKLGELAEIDLASFSMAGKEWASLRRAINRAERDGLEFALMEAGEAKAHICDLQSVSDAWLRHSKAGEKRFSLGSFDRDYIQAFPVAVVRHEGRIVAFANLLTSRDNVFVDLMRFQPGVHRGVMDLLMVKLIERLKAEGYRTLNLGMAPLSNLPENGTAWERLGNMVFENGNRFYGFKGLLAFKSKFAPDWQPRYLLVEAGKLPYRPAAAAAILIAGGVRRIFRA